MTRFTWREHICFLLLLALCFSFPGEADVTEAERTSLSNYVWEHTAVVASVADAVYERECK